MLAGCGPQGKTDNLTDEPLNTTTTVADWSEGEAPAVFESDGWTNGSPFNTQWTANNVIYDNGVAKLTITDNPNGSEETFTEYYGGEMRTYQYFGYGDYEVSMKPSNKPGTASTFFTCTGSYDTNPHTGQPNPWDEIDIEFLGEDTTKVQFNYYVNGVGGHEYMYDLGFDASEDFHTYGFRWTEDYITWFVDGEPVYRVNATESSPMPSTAGRVLMNYWCGSSAAENWMGKFENPDDKGPEYQWVKTSAEVDWGEIPEPVEVEEYEGDWSKIDAASVEFSNSDNGVGTDYKVTPAADGKSAQITYTKAGNYDNVNFNASEAAAEKNWMHLTLKNNSSTATNNIRINIRNAENTATINAFGFGNDSLLVTNAGEGTTISLSPNMTMEVEIKFNGIAGNVELMLDSMQANVVEKASDITISDIKFDIQGELEIPETPVEDNNGVTINGQKVKFDGNVGGQPYAINTDEESNSMNVTYTAAQGESYHNIKADIAAIASDKNIFSATITNNGENVVSVRVDIVASRAVNANTNVCNLSATMDGESVYTDLEWGGSMFNIPAGATVEIEVVYDTSYGPSTLQFLIDTATYGDTATHEGDVTFSEMEFSGEGEVTDPEPEEPITPPEGGTTEVDLGAVKVEGNTVENGGPYTAKVEDGKLGVTYTEAKGNSYLNVNLTQGAIEVAAQNNVLTVQVTNNGTATVELRIDVMTDTKVNNTNACNISATQDGVAVRTDTDWGGSFFTIEAGKTVTIQVVYDGARTITGIQFLIDSFMGTDTTHAGNITIGDMAFFNHE
ncbi:MAG TPA: family 16 glycosylhydrolase [Candidatus Coproplasma stercoripullorum]|uniref:Beta-glucanase n=1 Tax=Candidatus Coproplasma stercoripullorum TaxID=2840751 RepID=A0A9D1DAE9_9FIRM|nr:family 16 glycosylhydrolase [Candidatus Coproplasma stercoripullorum]